MHLYHVKTLLSAGDSPNKVLAICCSPNNMKIAVATADRVVHLYDEIGEKRDKFATKPADPSLGKKHYQVKGLAFSPKSDKIAVGQTDNIIFVYNIGDAWGDKKVICSKYIQQSAVTAVVWPSEPEENVCFMFGTAEGKVRIANDSQKAKNTRTLYSTDSYVVSLAISNTFKSLASGHADGSIVHYSLETSENSQGAQGQLCKHSCPPYALTWVGQAIVAAGNDKRVCFYNIEGQLVQDFDYSTDSNEKEFSVASGAPGGQALAIGSFDRIRAFTWTPKKAQWEETGGIVIPNLYTVTSLAWKRDGSKLLIGSLCGSAEMFDCSLKRVIYRGKFEMTYVALSQLIVKNLTTGARVILKSHYGYEIEKVKIMGNDRYIVGNTSDTLLLGDLSSCRLSEVAWPESGGNERFNFEAELACMIFNAGELTLVEYGTNDILGSVRTEFINPHLVSVRINERRIRDIEHNKKIAYLLDAKTICVYDLVENLTVATITSEARIDWLELNETCRKLLYRDKRMRLHLYDLDQQTRSSLLEYCSYVQWVPQSDVVVAQGRGNLCVWYNIDTPERVTTFSLKGDVIELERAYGRTEIIVQCGVDTVSYTLDESLIEFGTALEDGDLTRGLAFLETLEMSPETEGMWQTLSTRSLEEGELAIAERCFAALGNVSKSFYLRETLKMAEAAHVNSLGVAMMSQDEHSVIRARLAALAKDLRVTEAIYLGQGKVQEAMQVYQQLHMWEEALRIAKEHSQNDFVELRESYYKHLLKSGQEQRAAGMKEKEEDYSEAVNLYMRAGLPAQGARLLLSHKSLCSQGDLVERVASALVKGGLYEKAGDLFEKVEMAARAISNYRNGKAFRKAVELSREAFPKDVVALEEEWGNHLKSLKQYDAAINHYIEAGSANKAAECAMLANQWNKAAQIADTLDDNIAEPFYKQIAAHYASVKEYGLAECYFVKANLPREAVDMYTNAGMWEAAHKIALKCISESEVETLYVNQAKDLEMKGKLKEAERLYIMIEDPDKAIAMYRKHRQYDAMVRLVSIYYKDILTDTHSRIAKELESEGSFHGAEKHYISAKDWKSACQMYRGQEAWDDAYRVAKTHGGAGPGKQVAFMWAKYLGGEAAVKLLNKFGLLEDAIEYAAERSAFDFAFDLAQNSLKSKLPELHLKYALFLEDNGQYKEAEENFVKASHPKEAVLMHVHAQQWEDARRIAELYDPSSLTDVLIGQAKLCFEQKTYQEGEAYLLRAQRPDLIVNYYKDDAMWQDALRIAKEYIPSMLNELQAEMSLKNSGNTKAIIDQAKTWEQSGEPARAVEVYMSLSKDAIDDLEVLCFAWSKAGELAIKFLPNKSTDIVSNIANRLAGIEKFQEAAELLLQVNLAKDALEVLLSGHLWDRARHVARDVAPQYEEYIESAYKQYLKDSGQSAEMVNVDVATALDMYADGNQWEKCLQVAENNKNEQLLNKYVARYAAHLIKQNSSLEALKQFKKYGAAPNSSNFNIYKKISIDVLSLPSEGVGLFTAYTELRDVLHNLILGMRKTVMGNSDDAIYFEKLLLLAHWHALRTACQPHKQLQMIEAKISISLLRYTDILPADKYFYEAGINVKLQGWGGCAFVFLNRFLDLCDAIEEQSVDMLEHVDFSETDIPFEIPLPEECSISNQKKEEAKEWILTVSVDQSVPQNLPTDNRGVFEGSLIASDASKPAAPCIVTGYPVLKGGLSFKYGNHFANKEDWNTFIKAIKSTHSSEGSNVVHFITTWCGSPVQ